MNLTLIESIADAVLYEGYVLYPYRPSAVKNRQRWNFGVLYSKAYSDHQAGTDPCSMQTQCLIRGSDAAAVGVRVRFLHAVTRQIVNPAGAGRGAEDECEIVDALDANGERLQSWQEATPCDAVIEPLPLAELLSHTVQRNFTFRSGQQIEAVKGESEGAAFTMRTREGIACRVEMHAVERGPGLFEVTVAVANTTPGNPAISFLSREEALMTSLLSAHTVLNVTGGEFLSLLDPPEDARDFAAKCKNIGTWPVLVGEDGSRDTMLSSPIILYDYPKVAPESPGNLFDGTEIDEILALRILTLTDDEKREIRQGDRRARDILNRTEAMPPEQFLKLHGALRGMRSVNEADADSPQEDDDERM